MKITRGTTPTISLTVEDFELYDTDEIHLYFSQGGKMRFKKVSPEVIIEGNTIRTELTQEETYKLKKGEEVKMQFKVKRADEKILPSGETYCEVDDIDDNDEVI